ncbi:MAG: AAA family ATPase [Alistipes sp.]|nr:AAA family ATPase [Alistipes sp.]
MDSNNITNPTKGIVKSPELSHLTNDQLLKMEELRRAEACVKPYIVDMSKELPDEQPLISIDGSCICSRGNISAICGEAKSKKTFLASALIASAMAIPLDKLNNFKNVEKNMDLNVLWIDTEQGERHVRRVIERISTMTGAKMGGLNAEPRLMTLSLRELAPMERYTVMNEAIKRYPFDLVVIDGIADLQRNTNDLEESDALVGALMALSTNTNTHILCVLHTNPGSDKARGHLGSALQRKAETVIYVHRNGNSSIVEPQFCRNEPFERFAFCVSEEGIPEICDIPQSESSGTNDNIVRLLNEEFGGVVERTTLRNKIMSIYNISSNTARMRISRLIDKGLLMADNDLVRSQAYTDAHKCTSAHTHEGVQDVQPVQDVQSVQDVQPVQASLALDCPPSRPQYYGHYDEDECPF